jgi:DNA (cytosine-5)-methyltransferase 1
MNHASLFSGIGGFDLAAEWMGWTNVLHVERDPFCQKVLKHHFPNSQSFDDVKTFDGRPFRGRVDILTGGFPCQPYSSAGKRLGKDDERHLWPEMCRIISEISPAFVVGENVRGLLNWNGGVVFEEVCADLEGMGYEVWTGVLPAAGVGAPHRRDRIWFVAHRQDHGQPQAEVFGRERAEYEPHNWHEVRPTSDAVGGGRDAPNAERNGLEHSSKSGGVGESKGKARKQSASSIKATGKKRDAANADGKLSQRGNGKRKAVRRAEPGARTQSLGESARWEEFPTQSPICGGDDGLSRELDGITFSKWRAESIKAYGNAIVPQVAYQIFKAIQQTR